MECCFCVLGTENWRSNELPHSLFKYARRGLFQSCDKGEIQNNKLFVSNWDFLCTNFGIFSELIL